VKLSGSIMITPFKLHIPNPSKRPLTHTLPHSPRTPPHYYPLHSSMSSYYFHPTLGSQPSHKPCTT
jgi:hypothetical protein